MKKILTLIITFTTLGLAANDTIPIINTVLHGINTVVNVTKPTTVVTQPIAITTTEYLTTYTIYTTDKIIVYNGITYIFRDGLYYRYLKPIHYYPPHKLKYPKMQPPPPPKRPLKQDKKHRR